MPQHPIDINAYIHFAGFFHLGPRDGEMGRFCKLTFHTLPHPFYFHSNSGLFLKRRSHSSVPWFFLWCHHVLFNEPAYTNPPTYISNSRLSHFTKSAFSNLYLTLRCAAHRWDRSRLLFSSSSARIEHDGEYHPVVVARSISSKWKSLPWSWEHHCPQSASLHISRSPLLPAPPPYPPLCPRSTSCIVVHPCCAAVAEGEGEFASNAALEPSVVTQPHTPSCPPLSISEEWTGQQLTSFTNMCGTLGLAVHASEVSQR